MGTDVAALRFRARRWYLAAMVFQASLYLTGFGLAATVAIQLVIRWTREDPGPWLGLGVAVLAMMVGAMAFAALLLRLHSWSMWCVARGWFLPWTPERWGRARSEAGLIVAEAIVLCFAGLNGVFRQPFRQDLAAAGGAALVAGLVAAIVGLRLARLLWRMKASDNATAASHTGRSV